MTKFTGAIMSSPSQLSWRSVELSSRYDNFPFLMAAVRCLYVYLDTHNEHLVVFITMQNLAVIDAVVSIICNFNILRVRFENVYSRPQKWRLCELTS